MKTAQTAKRPAPGKEVPRTGGGRNYYTSAEPVTV